MIFRPAGRNWYLVKLEAELEHVFEIDTANRVATLRISGMVTVDELIAGLRDILENPEWNDRFGIMLVYEPTALLGDVELDDIKHLQDWLKQRQTQATRSHKVKSALVCSLDNNRVMLELHKLSFTENALVDEQVFDNEADALAWLKS